MYNFFGKTKKLEGEAREFLEIIQKAGLIFNEAIQEYFNGDYEDYEKRVVDVSELNSIGDRLRRRIKEKLYKHMLIPDARGDVWDLLESLGNILDVIKKVMENLSFEKPKFPDFTERHFLKIADYTQKAMDELMNATNAYFHEFVMVNSFTTKVLFFENEVDKLEEKPFSLLIKSTA